MNLRDLAYVLAVAETGGFAKAAEQCHTSQPTLSTQVKKLEQELGLTLFERTRKGAVITSEGREALFHIKKILEEADYLRVLASRSRKIFGGELKLGTVPTSGPYLLPELLRGMKDAYPDLNILIIEAVSETLLEKLERREIDAALLFPPFSTKGLAVESVAFEPLVLALPPHHILLRSGAIETETIEQENMILLEEGHCLREHTLDAFKKAGLNFKRLIFASGLESMRQMVASGTGIGLIPQTACSGPFAEIAHLALHQSSCISYERKLVLTWVLSRTDRKSFEEFAALARSVLLEADLGLKKVDSQQARSL